MNKKQLYSAPEAELLVVRFEENFCQSPNNSWDGPATSSTTWGDEGDDNGME